MRYNTKTISLAQLPIGRNGFVEPLCQTCKTLDCENPILLKEVAIFGVIREIKVMQRGTDDLAVVFCEGYSNYEEDGE